MKRCWLHIGMHKTGTTSVQSALARNELQAGWKYIMLQGRQNMGAGMFAMFSSHPERYEWFIKRGYTREWVWEERRRLHADLERTIRESPEENFIISGESICLIDPGGVAKMGRFLRRLCDEIRVIGYVRSPIAFKTSYFQQRIKHGPCDIALTKVRLEYRKRFEKFDKAFGIENVHLHEFAPAEFTKNCVVTDFCEQIGMTPPPSSAITRVNESLCREACSILYAYRKFGPGYGKGGDALAENKRLIAPLLTMEGKRFQISPSLAIASLASETKDLVWIENRLGKPILESSECNDSQIQSEADLLNLEPGACERFAREFEKLYSCQIPAAKIPTGSPVNPLEIAELVGYCRGLSRDHIALARQPKPPSRRPPRVVACWKFLKKRYGRLFGSASTAQTQKPPQTSK
jgi:hypothetical protein